MVEIHPAVECPACLGAGSTKIPYGDVVSCNWCSGHGMMTQADLERQRPPFGRGRPCCGKAKLLPRICVCSFQTWCPSHGRRCNGSHD